MLSFVYTPLFKGALVVRGKVDFSVDSLYKGWGGHLRRGRAFLFFYILKWQIGAPAGD